MNCTMPKEPLASGTYRGVRWVRRRECSRDMYRVVDTLGLGIALWHDTLAGLQAAVDAALASEREVEVRFADENADEVWGVL